MSDLLVLLSPLWPLLLALSKSPWRLLWSAHLALLPAAALLLVSQPLMVELPWLYAGAGMGLDSQRWWWLAVSVLFWSSAAFLGGKTAGAGGANRLLLLSMAGQLGAILSMDMIVFLSFSTLMGYACVGVLCAQGDGAARRAGRLYLMALVVADLLLFEAMLLVAGFSGSVGFTSLPEALSTFDSSTLYLALVMTGFALKIGLWPLHQWLPLAHHPQRLATFLLLWLGPVATGLLGLAHWLPLGKVVAPGLGRGLQAFGVAAMLYCLMVGIVGAQRQRRPAYVVIMVTGGLVTALGAAMVTPELWQRYGGVAWPLMVALGIGVSLGVAGWQSAGGRAPTPVGVSPPRVAIERCYQACVALGRRVALQSGFAMLARWLIWGGEQRRLSYWVRLFETGERWLRVWRVALSLLLLLCIVAVALWLLQVEPP
ncbi:proton-conducting transporter membrane subunit [Ferrimonas kyonanensis]|uniref:proton-conducting transporter transmembrane domain-containing protein n=1 Tax=Ferrimonas kyonanensis TaxID=364763 RepID=UPI0004094487|nr:proton-conducting transporter membrane subunit [Ferrimonas kyonanensis]